METIIKTTDTEEIISEKALPSAQWCDGYDYMERATAQGWTTLALWGKDGYDFGQWPYVIGFVRVVRDGARRLHGFGVYVEGDLTTEYYRSWEACNEAISRQAFWYWNAGQSDGPRDLAATFEDMQAEYKVPVSY